MILPFNADRLLTRVATAGLRRGASPSAPGSRPGSPVEASTPTGAGAVRRCRRGGNVPPGPQRDRLERLIATGVVGRTGTAAPRPDQRRSRLVAGVQLLVAIRSGHAAARPRLSPARRRVRSPTRCGGRRRASVSEWSLVAVHAEPFLVADDVLIDVCDEPVHLAGASMITLRDDRVATVHTYYDEGSLVEQVILRGQFDAGAEERTLPSRIEKCRL